MPVLDSSRDSTILVTSYVMNGLGFLLAFMVLVLYLQRLAIHHVPGREIIVSTFLPLGEPSLVR